MSDPDAESEVSVGTTSVQTEMDDTLEIEIDDMLLAEMNEGEEDSEPPDPQFSTDESSDSETDGDSDTQEGQTYQNKCETEIVTKTIRVPTPESLNAGQVNQAPNEIKVTKTFEIELTGTDIKSIKRRRAKCAVATAPPLSLVVHKPGAPLYSSSRTLELLRRSGQKCRKLAQEKWEIETQLQVAHSMLGKKLGCGQEAFAVPPKLVVTKPQCNKSSQTTRMRPQKKPINDPNVYWRVRQNPTFFNQNDNFVLPSAPTPMQSSEDESELEENVETPVKGQRYEGRPHEEINHAPETEDEYFYWRHSQEIAGHFMLYEEVYDTPYTMDFDQEDEEEIEQRYAHWKANLKNLFAKDDESELEEASEAIHPVRAHNKTEQDSEPPTLKQVLADAPQAIAPVQGTLKLSAPKLPDFRMIKIKIVAGDISKPKQRKAPKKPPSTVCPFCQKKFKTAGSLKKHKSVTHRGDNRDSFQVECSTCNKLISKNNLSMHNKSLKHLKKIAKGSATKKE